MKKNRSLLNILSQTIALPFIAIALILLLQSLSNYGEKNQQITKDNVVEIIEKYAIQCYASEGSYPPDLAYLVDHYGLILNEERFIYDYDIFASNVMPDIQVYDNFR